MGTQRNRPLVFVGGGDYYIMKKTYKISTLGCKVNQQESEAMAARFEELGFLPAGRNEEPTVCVINSCTVTSIADSKTRQKIRQARMASPDALVCVVGCLPETAADAVLSMPEVDLIVGSPEKSRTPDLVLEGLKAHRKGDDREVLPRKEEMPTPGLEGLKNHRKGDNREILPRKEDMPTSGMEELKAHRKGDNRGILPRKEEMPPSLDGARTRAFIKAEDGCDRFCAYCIIPYARGAVRSRPKAELLAEAQYLLKTGYKELVLTGVNLALYGSDAGLQREPGRQNKNGANLALYGQGDGTDIFDLVKSMCSLNAASEYRIRLGSLEPTVINASYAEKIAGIKGVCPHFHLSLQSGSEKILKAMGRPYSPGDFEAIVNTLRSIDPLFSITTDIIVGFPGETDADFDECLEFVKKTGFAGVHVFKYSKRPGTKAADMPGQTPQDTKNARSTIMLAAAAESKARFLGQNAGKKRRALILSTDKTGRFVRGLTDNGIDFRLASDPLLQPNEFADIIVPPA